MQGDEHTGGQILQDLQQRSRELWIWTTEGRGRHLLQHVQACNIGMVDMVFAELEKALESFPKEVLQQNWKKKR